MTSTFTPTNSITGTSSNTGTSSGTITRTATRTGSPTPSASPSPTVSSSPPPAIALSVNSGTLSIIQGTKNLYAPGFENLVLSGSSIGAGTSNSITLTITWVSGAAPASANCAVPQSPFSSSGPVGTYVASFASSTAPADVQNVPFSLDASGFCGFKTTYQLTAGDGLGHQAQVNYSIMVKSSRMLRGENLENSGSIFDFVAPSSIETAKEKIGVGIVEAKTGFMESAISTVISKAAENLAKQYLPRSASSQWLAGKAGVVANSFRKHGLSGKAVSNIVCSVGLSFMISKVISSEKQAKETERVLTNILEGTLSRLPMIMTGGVFFGLGIVGAELLTSYLTSRYPALGCLSGALAVPVYLNYMSGVLSGDLIFKLAASAIGSTAGTKTIEAVWDMPILKSGVTTAVELAYSGKAKVENSIGNIFNRLLGV